MLPLACSRLSKVNYYLATPQPRQSHGVVLKDYFVMVKVQILFNTQRQYLVTCQEFINAD